MLFNDAESDTGVLLDLFLQILRVLLVTFRRDYGQRVDVKSTQSLTCSAANFCS